MNLAAKNILLSIVIVVMIIAACFTVDAIKPRIDLNSVASISDISNNEDTVSPPTIDNQESEKETTVDKTVEETDDKTTQDNTTDESNDKKDTTKKDRRQRNRNGINGRNNNNFDRNFKPINVKRNDKNIIYVILFGIESIVVGVCSTLLVLINSKKFSKKVLD